MDPYVQTLADLSRHFALFFRGGADEAWFKTWPQVAGVLLAPADAREPVAIAELDPNAVAQSEAKLFYGVSSVTLPLTESSWSNAAQLYCQTETFATRAAYREEGLALTDDLNLPEDHLGISLEFLAYLLEKGKNDRARLFLSEHILNWWPRASETILARDDSEPIRPVVKALTALLDEVKATLEEA